MGAWLPAFPVVTSTHGTIRFGSRSGFAYHDQHLHPLTTYSVRPQRFHFSVPTSLYITSKGILTLSSIGIAVRLSLRTRLTLIRLALIRNPESFGGRVSHPPYRYLYLHLLFLTLQQGLSLIFNAEQECSPTTS